MKPIKCNTCNYREYVNEQFLKTVETISVKCLDRDYDMRKGRCSGVMKAG